MSTGCLSGGMPPRFGTLGGLWCGGLKIFKLISPPPEVDRLVDDYRSGAGVNELAERYGVHRATVSAHLTRRGTPRRRPGLGVDEGGQAVLTAPISALRRSSVLLRSMSLRRAGQNDVPRKLDKRGTSEQQRSGRSTWARAEPVGVVQFDLTRSHQRVIGDPPPGRC